MGRSQGIGKRHKEGTGNNKRPAAREVARVSGAKRAADADDASGEQRLPEEPVEVELEQPPQAVDPTKNVTSWPT